MKEISEEMCNTASFYLLLAMRNSPQKELGKIQTK